MQSSPKINTYLWYFYIFPNEIPSWLDKCITPENTCTNYSPDEAGYIFEQVFAAQLKKNNNGYVIVPISGGWDSRILLGAALERFHTQEIKTLTFGVPGQLDYDIGRLVAETAGVEHHAVDLSKVDLHWEDLLASVKEAPWTYVPDAFFNRCSLAQVASKNDLVLSGFMGDPLTGGHKSRAITKDEAVEGFIKKQRRVKNIRLTPESYNPARDLPALPENPSIAYSELLDFGIRQANCIAPIVTPQQHWTGWGGNMGRMSSTGALVLAPFAHPDWAAYWINAPKEAKQGQRLYLEMMKQKFPRLAALPSKYSMGYKAGSLTHSAAKIRRKVLGNFDKHFPRPKLRYAAHLNYLDYGDAFRNRDDYLEVLRKAIVYLRENEYVPWINLEQLLKDHGHCKANYSDAFRVLIGLALNLQAELNI